MSEEEEGASSAEFILCAVAYSQLWQEMNQQSKPFDQSEQSD